MFSAWTSASNQLAGRSWILTTRNDRAGCGGSARAALSMVAGPKPTSSRAGMSPRGRSERDARQQRRQLWRRAWRQKKVFKSLQKAGLLPSGPAALPQERHDLLLKLDADLAEQYPAIGDRAAAHLLPYRLRAAALDGPLPAFALGRAIYHLAQRRVLEQQEDQEGRGRRGKGGRGY